MYDSTRLLLVAHCSTKGELRHWICLRSKLALKLSIGVGEMVVAGDTYNVVFRGEDGQPLRIPLAVYEVLAEGTSGSKSKRLS